MGSVEIEKIHAVETLGRAQVQGLQLLGAVQRIWVKGKGRDAIQAKLDQLWELGRVPWFVM